MVRFYALPMSPGHETQDHAIAGANVTGKTTLI